MLQEDPGAPREDQLVRSNQEDRLKPYVTELENSIKEKLDRAAHRQRRGRRSSSSRNWPSKARKLNWFRQNKERLMARPTRPRPTKHSSLPRNPMYESHVFSDPLKKNHCEYPNWLYYNDLAICKFN